MKRIILSSVLFLLSANIVSAQLTAFEKTADFQVLAALFDKLYGPYDWKKQSIQYDGLQLQPWLNLIGQSQTDLDYFEICSEYVAKYQDGHSIFLLPSTFYATLGFTTDLYSGKVLIDGIDPTILDPTKFPFQVGDEIVSVDGKTAANWVTYFSQFRGIGNPATALRQAASTIPNRDQSAAPRAHEIADTATVVIKSNSGTTTTYTVPWLKSGTPYIQAQSTPDPTVGQPTSRQTMADRGAAGKPWMKFIRKLDNYRLPVKNDILGFGLAKPVYALPDGFKVHTGLQDFDAVFSGIFPAGNLNIGLLRIATMDNTEFDVQAEISFLSSRTDALIVDVSRNPGGYGCTAEAIAQELIPTSFHSLQQQFRVTWSDILTLQQELSDAVVYGTQDDIDSINRLLSVYQDAFAHKQRLTAGIPLCGSTSDLVPAMDPKTGKVIAYSKPILLLTDEFSASAAELLAAILQDNQRVLVYGARTAGAGGSVDSFGAGIYSETGVNLTRSLAIRNQTIATLDYPTAPLIEGIGVRPDKVADYMTSDNLGNHGVPFVGGMVQALLDYVKSKQ
jgi:hypothetical protein